MYCTIIVKQRLNVKYDSYYTVLLLELVCGIQEQYEILNKIGDYFREPITKLMPNYLKNKFQIRLNKSLIYD